MNTPTMQQAEFTTCSGCQLSKRNGYDTVVTGATTFMWERITGVLTTVTIANTRSVSVVPHATGIAGRNTLNNTTN